MSIIPIWMEFLVSPTFLDTFQNSPPILTEMFVATAGQNRMTQLKMTVKYTVNGVNQHQSSSSSLYKPRFSGISKMLSNKENLSISSSKNKDGLFRMRVLPKY